MRTVGDEGPCYDVVAGALPRKRVRALIRRVEEWNAECCNRGSGRPERTSELISPVRLQAVATAAPPPVVANPGSLIVAELADGHSLLDTTTPSSGTQSFDHQDHRRRFPSCHPRPVQTLMTPQGTATLSQLIACFLLRRLQDSELFERDQHHNPGPRACPCPETHTAQCRNAATR